MTACAQAFAEFSALRAQGLSTQEIADRCHYTPSYVREVLRDPSGERRRARYLARLSPLARATSRLNDAA